MNAHCLRCGVDVSEYGRVCKDCRLVDREFSEALREVGRAVIRQRSHAHHLLTGWERHVRSAPSALRRAPETGGSA